MLAKRRLTHFFLCLLSILVVYPFFDDRNIAGKILGVIFSLILISGVRAVSGSSRIKTIISISLGVPAMVALWVDQTVEIRIIDQMSGLLLVIFSFFTIYCILTHMFKAKKVDSDLLAGAASVYLLIGISWGILYSLLELSRPGSFYIAETIKQKTVNTWSVFNYYSFTTLTTTGYGDITPSTIHAQSLSILEAVTGVLFTAFLVSRLVGMYLHGVTQGEKIA